VWDDSVEVAGSWTKFGVIRPQQQVPRSTTDHTLFGRSIYGAARVRPKHTTGGITCPASSAARPAYPRVTRSHHERRREGGLTREERAPHRARHQTESH
jgi:hypothetical protein